MRSAALPWLLALYCLASLAHFTHNAQFLAHYPNLPASWTAADVYLAWGAVTALGVAGFVLWRGGHVRAGLTLLFLYAALGFAGLLHYTRAPLSHHSTAMNLSIWAEAACAAALLVYLAGLARRTARNP